MLSFVPLTKIERNEIGIIHCEALQIPHSVRTIGQRQARRNASDEDAQSALLWIELWTPQRRRQMSKTMLGRRRIYAADGSWTLVRP